MQATVSRATLRCHKPEVSTGCTTLTEATLGSYHVSIHWFISTSKNSNMPLAKSLGGQEDCLRKDRENQGFK